MARDQKQLHPRLQAIIPKLIAECKKQGITIKIGECLRTVAEQNALYAQGRTKAGSIVTNAKGTSYSSMHQWGVAFDFFLDMDIDGDGKKSDDAYNNKKKTFQKVGAIGKKLGLEWGGDWKSPVDMPHFQLPDWGSTASKLKKQYGKPEKFFATWTSASSAAKPNTTTTTTKKVSDTKMPTIKKGSEGKAVKVAQVILGISADGEFGAKTHNAVVAFQKKHGLTQDGVVGANTWKALLESV